MSFDFKGKVAIITGGASGIGFAYAKELIKNGVKGVTILDINQTYGAIAAQELGEDKCTFIKTDITDGAAFEDAFKTTIAKYGGLDIVINNAGMANENLWDLEIDVNAKAVTRGCLLAIKYMNKEEGGKGGMVINTSSYLGTFNSAGCPVYCATKHYVISLNRCYGTNFYYDITGIKFITICPSATVTDLYAGTQIMKQFEKQGAKYLAALTSVPTQTPEHVASEMIKVVSNGKNGSVWVVGEMKPAYEDVPTIPTLDI